MVTSNSLANFLDLPVLLSDPEASLHSTVFASREGLAIAHKLDNAFPQQAANIVIDLNAITPGDFVVRSVVAGARRKLEILASDNSGLGFRHLIAMIPQNLRRFATQKVIEFVDGHTVVLLPNAIEVISFNGR